MSNLDASNFIYSAEVYQKQFNMILVGMIKCYKKIIEDGIQIPVNNENKIRDVFIKQYLRNDTIREEFGLKKFYFDREALEDKTEGRTDIRVLTFNSFQNNEAYYVFECKRLDKNNANGTSGLNGKYISEGMKRFVNSYYNSYYSVNGMLGFIIDKMNVSDNVKCINNLLKNSFSDVSTCKYLTKYKLVSEFTNSYYSSHTNNKNKNLKIFHLMFDFVNRA